jgi:hypothetical protein
MAAAEYAFFALGVDAVSAGVYNLTSAFTTGFSSRVFPTAEYQFWMVGEYQFDAADQAAAHTIDAQCVAPIGVAQPNYRTAPAAYPPFSIHNDGVALAKTLFAVHIGITAHGPGRHTIALIVDGAERFELPFDVLSEPSSLPDDVSSLTDE